MFSLLPYRVRTGIIEWFGYCRCNLHKKVWKEGDNYEEFGGKACKFCCENAKVIYRVDIPKSEMIYVRGKETILFKNLEFDKKGLLKIKKKKNGK